MPTAPVSSRSRSSSAAVLGNTCTTTRVRRPPTASEARRARARTTPPQFGHGSVPTSTRRPVHEHDEHATPIWGVLDGTDSTLALFPKEPLARSTKCAIVESVSTTTATATHEQLLATLADLEVARWGDEGERAATLELYGRWPTEALRREVEGRLDA